MNASAVGILTSAICVSEKPDGNVTAFATGAATSAPSSENNTTSASVRERREEAMSTHVLLGATFW